MKSLKVSLGLVSVLVAVAAMAVPPGTADEIRERLQPFGELCRAGENCATGGAGAGAAAASAGAAMSGQQVYNQFCGTCHGAGVAGAPVTGDAAAWQPRIAKGMDVLWQHTQNGFNAMPPKGTCMACSDEELRAAMDYLVEQGQ